MITPDMSTKYMGLELKNPIIASSSGFTDDVEKIYVLAKNRVAAVVLKSLFEEEIMLETEESFYAMTGRSYIFPESLSYINKELTPGILERYLELIAASKKRVSIPIIASINCISDQKWTYFARQIEQAGADALELNIFQLPAEIHRESIDHLRVLEHIIENVLKVISIPVTLKIGPYYSNLGNTIRRLSHSEIQGLVLFNRSFAPDYDIEELTISNNQVLSSPSDFHLPLRWMALLSPYVDCDLVASTGIHHGDEIIKQILAGAKAVQIASTLYRNGVEEVGRMLDVLSGWMLRHGFKKIENFRGILSHQKCSNPAELERVQFMKYFNNFIVQQTYK